MKTIIIAIVCAILFGCASNHEIKVVLHGNRVSVGYDNKKCGSTHLYDGGGIWEIDSSQCK